MGVSTESEDGPLEADCRMRLDDLMTCREELGLVEGPEIGQSWESIGVMPWSWAQDRLQECWTLVLLLFPLFAGFSRLFVENICRRENTGDLQGRLNVCPSREGGLGLVGGISFPEMLF